MASTAIHHQPGIFKSTSFMMTTPTGFDFGGELMNHLKSAVCMLVEQLNGIFGDGTGQPSASFGSFLGECLES